MKRQFFRNCGRNEIDNEESSKLKRRFRYIEAEFEALELELKLARESDRQQTEQRDADDNHTSLKRTKAVALRTTVRLRGAYDDVVAARQVLNGMEYVMILKVFSSVSLGVFRLRKKQRRRWTKMRSALKKSRALWMVRKAIWKYPARSVNCIGFYHTRTPSEHVCGYFAQLVTRVAKRLFTDKIIVMFACIVVGVIIGMVVYKTTHR